MASVRERVDEIRRSLVWRPTWVERREMWRRPDVARRRRSGSEAVEEEKGRRQGNYDGGKLMERYGSPLKPPHQMTAL